MAVSGTVTAGKIFSADEVVTISELNKLGTPTVDISGAVGSLSLADGSVTNAKVAAATGLQYDKLEALATGELLVGNAGTATATALSGDATIAAGGAITIANNAVTTAKVLDNNITLAKLDDGTQGDVLYYGGSGAPTRLAKPSTPAGEVLTFVTDADEPAWTAPATHALNFEQIILSGTSYVYNNLVSATNTPLYGTAGQDDAWYLVDDTQGGGGTGMATTSGFTITEGNKVRISMTLHIDCQEHHIPVVGKVQRKNGSSGTWGDLYPNSVGDASSTRIQAAFISNALAHGRGMSNVCFSFIDDPTLDESGGAASSKDEPFYRVIYSTHRDKYIYLNRDAFYEATTDTGITPPEYRLASTLIVEEIAA